MTRWSNLTNVTFSEIEIGQSASLSQVLSQTDIEVLALVSGDVDPFHVDRVDSGATHPDRSTTDAVGGETLISAVLGTRLPGPGMSIRSERLDFRGEIGVGDHLTATVEVTAKSADSREVTFRCRCVNQHEEELVRGSVVVTAPEERVRYDEIAPPEVALRRGDSFATLFAQCQSLPPVSCGVIYPCDGPSLQGAQRAVERGLIDPLLIGPEAKIRAVAESEQIDLSSTRIHPTEGARAAAVEAVQMARDGKLQTLMKGSLHTDELLGAVVSSAHGLRTDRRVSHVFVMDVPSYPRMLLITDSAINVAPGLEEKVDIVQNAIDLAHILGIEQPRAAILSAVETVSGKIASTVEAAALCKMADRGQIRGGLLDGPLAFDNAISQRAAEAKNICSAVAGRADLLVVPNLEAGNMLAKQLSFLGGAEAAGIVMGARVPIVLTSRADSLRARLASTAVARLVAGQRDEQPAGGN